MYESFDSYIHYLKQNKDGFNESVYTFASSTERHNLESPHSLHDAWLTSITIKENRKRESPFNPKLGIEIVLFGPMHDRNIILNYAGVASYTINGIKNKINIGDTFQGDITCHQVTLNENGLIMHEILFTSKSNIIITCEEFGCVEEIYTPPLPEEKLGSDSN